MEMEWEPRIDVSNSDIRAAKSAWLAAQGSDGPQSRVDELRRGYIQLLRTQNRQMAEDLHMERAE
ncbi:MAG: hypothetical protein ACOH2F_11235 [Cellulomonas sp.]